MAAREDGLCLLSLGEINVQYHSDVADTFAQMAVVYGAYPSS